MKGPDDIEPCPDCGGYHDDDGGEERNLVSDLIPVPCTFIFIKSPKAWISTHMNKETGEFTPPFVICFN